MILTHRENNFDFIRIAAAYLVLFSHCWPLFGREREFISSFLNYETGGGLAVSIFFFTSGYLMCGSLLRRNDLFHFVMSRCLRILPGLAVTVLFGVFVVGPAYTELSLRDYFGQSATWLYLNNMVIFPIRFLLPGVFMHNPVQASVNGSLWTLPIEVACYILLFILFRLGCFRGPGAIFVAVAFIAASMIGQTFWHFCPGRIVARTFFRPFRFLTFYLMGAFSSLARPITRSGKRCRLALTWPFALYCFLLHPQNLELGLLSKQ